VRLGRPAALKLLAPVLGEAGFRERFLRESQLAASIDHPSILPVYDAGEEDGFLYIAMACVEGSDLKTLLAEEGPLPLRRALRIVGQIGSALDAAHARGLVHRDVKPANILLENSVERAILTDFGLARTIDDASLTQTGILAGTPHYMSPEQAMGEAIDYRSDLFSLGAVLYFMATAHPPFRGTNALGVLHRICKEDHRPAWRVNTDIPDELSDVIDRLLAKKPGRRFASAEEVQEKLASLLARAQQHGLGRRRFRGPRDKRLQWTLALATLAAAVIAAIGIGIWWWPDVPTQPAKVEVVDLRAGLSQWQQSENDFFNDLGAAIGELQSDPATSRYLQGGNDVWSREMQNVDRELSELEQTTGKLPD
jgi:eukaryotic-like serine/threonine-protein kinase